MRYPSTNGRCQPATLAEAVLSGLAPDGGLYVPQEIPRLDDAFFAALPGLALPEIAEHVLSPFLEPELDRRAVREIARSAFDFDLPLAQIDESTGVLELFHGPTLAFKDFGARFMARLFSRLAPACSDVTVLAATSGDTGSAVANGFFGLPGFRVVILYPSGQVSPLQEKQLTTLGGNVTALEVKGTFDDCQRMVKSAFADSELRARMNLTSANSINIARLLPQSLYYFRGAALAGKSPLAISVPSGNFGNLTAGLIAKRMGLKVERFVAATNANQVFPRYLEGADFAPAPSKRTLSNAMDVGDPSNFTRISWLYPSRAAMAAEIWSRSFSDDQTLEAMALVERRHAYVMDPHTAVGYLGLEAYRRERPGAGIVLSTAHPAKFGEVVEKAIGRAPELPPALAAALAAEKCSIVIEPAYPALRDLLSSIS